MRMPAGDYALSSKNGNGPATVHSDGDSIQLDPPTGPHLAYNENQDRYEAGDLRFYWLADEHWVSADLGPTPAVIGYGDRA